MCYIDFGKPESQKAAYPPSSEGLPSGRKKGGIANDYIPGLVLVLYVHCLPYRSVVSDFQGKKVAATIHGSDGCFKAVVLD